MSDLLGALTALFTAPIDDTGTPYRHIPEERLALYEGDGPRASFDHDTMVALEYLCLDWRARTRKR